MENNMEQMSHKERIMDLIERQVPEVKEIYQGTLTIFQRMLLWDCIEKFNWVEMSQLSSADAIQKCYKFFIQDIDKFITEETNPLTKVDITNFRKKMLNEPFKSCPQDFIAEMATMMHYENDLIKKYYFDQTPFHEQLEFVNIALRDSGDLLMEQLKDTTEALKSQLMASSQAERQVLNITGVHSPEGQQMLNEMKARCTKIGQICDVYFTNFFSKMEEVKHYLKEAKKLFQKKLSYNSFNLPMSEKVLSLKDLDDNFQIWTSAIYSVKEDMQKYEKDVIQMCRERYQGVQSDLFSKLVEHKNRLGQFLSDYLHMCVLTIKCPGNQYHKPSNSSSKKEQEETEAPKKKPSKTKVDKLENSPLNSTLKILGAQSFGQKFRIDASSSSVLLVDENLLPEHLSEGAEVQFKPNDITKCGKLKPENPPKLNEGFELKFYREEIEEPSRSKSKSSKSAEESVSLVVASFVRFWYRIKVEIYDRCQTLFAVSHPIGWRTGSNQLLQFHGSGTWYHWNVENVYEDLRIPQKVPLSAVLDMLDAQISNIQDQTSSSAHKTKYRSLSTNEKEFLRTMLLGENSTSEYVYLKDFIGTKASESKKRSCNDLVQKTPTVDFHTYFFALLKSLNSYLKSLWLDGLIYGLCSQETTSEVLMREKTPIGTVMLRPCTTQVHGTRCMEPRVDLSLDFKTNRDKHDHVDNINWNADKIKYLPEALSTNAPTLKYIQGVNNRKWPVKILLKHFTNDSRFIYRQTTFKLTVSFQVIDGQEESPSVNEKKNKADDLRVPDSASCSETFSSTFDNQSMITPSTPLGDQEMSPGLDDSPCTNPSDFNDVTQMGQNEEQDLELLSRFIADYTDEFNDHNHGETKVSVPEDERGKNQESENVRFSQSSKTRFLTLAH